jgi:predicted ATPase/DNA-binding SARP family transcriptional activator
VPSQAPTALPGRAPLAFAPLVGRRSDVEGIAQQLSRARLVTLVGPGGVGKTRLAAEVFAASPEPAYWVDLAPVGPELVDVAVADALGVHEGHVEGALAAAIDALSSKDATLVLDNAEHVADAAAKFCSQLLGRSASTKVLVTSREPLGAQGEVVWQVAPLSLPGAREPPEVVYHSEAVEFFVAKAQAASPSFELGMSNLEAVTSLCHRLDGLPLAIELAVANLRTLSLNQLLAGLDDIFGLLAGGLRGLPARQQALRASLDWSHQLLDESEKALLRRLSVFAGRFGLDAAVQVAGDGEATYSTLRRLVDKSLVVADVTGAEASYRLLSTVRQYAREKLCAAGEEDAYLGKHLAWCVKRALQAEPRLTGTEQAAELERLEHDLNDIRAGLEFARRVGNSGAALEIASALGRFWYLHGHYREGREWLDWAVVAGGPGVREAAKAKALWASGRLAFLQCEYTAAVRRLTAALRAYKKLNDAKGTATTLQVLGSVAREQGRYQQSERRHREARELFEAAGDASGVATSVGLLGFVAWLQGDLGKAAALCNEALDGFAHQGDTEGTAWSLLSLGVVASYRGDLGLAEELFGRSQALSTQIGFREGAAWCSNQLGLVALRRGEPGLAGRLLYQSFEIHRELGDQWRLASVLEALAATSTLVGDGRRAALLIGAAQVVREKTGAPVPRCEIGDYEATLAKAKDLLGPEAFEKALEEGKAMKLDKLASRASQPLADPPPVALAPSARPPRPALAVKALGPLEVSVGGRLLDAADWGWAKPRELFLILLSSPPKTKEQLGAMLWPDLGDEQLRNALHTALRDLRRALGDREWVLFGRGRYKFNAALCHYYDVSEFESALAAAQRAGPAALAHLERALSLYRGEFLEGSVLGEWAEERRRELSNRYRAALMATGAAHVAQGQLRRAAGAYERAIARDLFDEEAHRQLMKCLAQLGERARALRHYEELATNLQAHLGIGPAPETARLRSELLAGA